MTRTVRLQGVCSVVFCSLVMLMLMLKGLSCESSHRMGIVNSLKLTTASCHVIPFPLVLARTRIYIHIHS